MDLHSLAHELRSFLTSVHGQEAHQGADLNAGALPVLGRESKQGEDLDPRFDRPFDHLTHGVHSLPVPSTTGQALAPGPAPVAVHDDGDVPGDGPMQADLMEEL